MDITNVKINQVFDKDRNPLAIASITFDNCFVVRNIRIINNGQKVFAAMPSYKTKNGVYVDYAHPIDSEFRQLIDEKVLEEYRKTVGE